MAAINGIPMATSVPSTYSESLEEVGRELTVQQKTTLARIRGGLQDAGSTLADGRKIETDFHVVQWLLDNVV